MPEYYDIKVPIEKPGRKKHWLKVGFGTPFQSEWGGGIMCTFDAIPVNWDGQFLIAPAKKKTDANS